MTAKVIATSVAFLDVKSQETRTIPHPIYSVSPDGKVAVTADFRRITEVRPGYGYNGLPDPHRDELAPADSGIFRIDMRTGESKLIISLKQISETGTVPKSEPAIKHYFNHLLFNPDGSRFIALHRWRYPSGKRLTRMITATPDGDDIRVVIPNGYASHFIWRDPDHILCQSKDLLGNSNWGNFLFADREGPPRMEVGRDVLDGSGHIFVLAWQRVDLKRHLSERSQPLADSTPVPRQVWSPDRSGAFSFTKTLRWRMASRHASSPQPRRPIRLHRCS